MTTAAQVKTLLQPVLARHGDLALIKRKVIVVPVRHVLCAILIDGTAVPNGIVPRWFANHFFGLGGRTHIAWGGLLQSRQTEWDVRHPQIQTDLLEVIESEALGRVRALRDLNAFVNFVSKHVSRHLLLDDPKEVVIVNAALGNLDVARLAARSPRLESYSEAAGLDDEDLDHLQKVQELCRLLEADDLPGMAAHLHAWEAENVRKNKLEHLWEPSPFPLEDLI